MPLFPTIRVILISSAGVVSAHGQASVPASVDPTTFSPDGVYGVTVPSSPVVEQPDGSYDEVKNAQNAIIEIKTGHVVGVIKGDVAFEHRIDSRINVTREASS